MTETTTKVMTCDRCGFVQSIAADHPAAAYPWGHLYAHQNNGPVRIEKNKAPRDVCPDCMEILGAWWKGGALMAHTEAAIQAGLGDGGQA